jgi:hypothetical protein
MTYLDVKRLEAIDPASFRTQAPYPWVNPAGLLTNAGYDRLRETLPDVSLFTSHFGETRLSGQQNHDRFSLPYRDDLPVAATWKAFVAELRGTAYQTFVRRLIGARSFELSFVWHYTPQGCSVSPHCDSRRKLGSHIFYFNTEEDWDPAWGGETLILDDGGRFEFRSAPHFEEFERITVAEALGNQSLLFARKGHSWHGVRALTCPQGHLRKIFIAVINRYSPLDRVRRFLGEPPRGYE